MNRELSSFLNLKPLDRVQINSRHEIAEMSFGRVQGRQEDLPYLYFQRVTDDGLLEVRSPGGYVTTIAPQDICDVIPGTAVVIRAMPDHIAKDRAKLSHQERVASAPSECYADAYVLYAAKDRWNRPEFLVWFKDESLNTRKRPWIAPIHDEDRRRISALARRTAMPVTTVRGGASYSADAGCENELDFNYDLVRSFFNAAMMGNSEAVSVLTMAGAKRPTRSSMNKLLAAVP